MKKQHSKWTVWSIICFLGIPWPIITIILGVVIKVELMESRGKEFHITDPDHIQLILVISLGVWFLVIIRNMRWLDSDRKIGMFTWLGKYKYQPPDVSVQKKKALHPVVNEEYLSDKPDGLVLAKKGKTFIFMIISKQK